MENQPIHQPINHLVNENYVYANVLHYFGIEFYEYSDKTLEQVCSEKGLKPQLVMKHLEDIAKEKEAVNLSLVAYPVEIVVEYLKYNHHQFVKYNLTYLSTLINNLTEDSTLVNDLKFVFPMFVQEFIEHLYEEEDTFFEYILKLNKALQNTGSNWFEINKAIEQNALQHFAMEHHQHENAMSGIRNITQNYEVTPQTSLHLKVIYNELQQFENMLYAHARIENEVLFPKAILLETEVKKQIDITSKLN